MTMRHANVICDGCNGRVSLDATVTIGGEVPRAVLRGVVVQLAKALRWKVDALTGQATCPGCGEVALISRGSVGP